MKTRPIVFVLLIALVVGAGWWFIQLSTSKPAGSAETSSSADSKPTQVKPVPQVTALAPQPGATTSAFHPKINAQSELGTAIDDIAGLLQAGDLTGAFEKYTPPEELANMAPKKKAVLEQLTSRQATADPETQRATQTIISTMATLYQSLKGLKPELNAAGDEATYHPPLPPGIVLAPGAASRPVTFVKIDGKWYVKGGL